jgi:hypothetical protein
MMLLKHENTKLKQEQDFLKEAAAHFAIVSAKQA